MPIRINRKQKRKPKAQSQRRTPPVTYTPALQVSAGVTPPAPIPTGEPNLPLAAATGDSIRKAPGCRTFALISNTGPHRCYLC